jgi:hypothetical protein
VGFLNPILYANPEIFNDITDGNNLVCNGAPAFYCTKGWDPVTGLGTPNLWEDAGGIYGVTVTGRSGDLNKLCILLSLEYLDY